MNRLSKLLFCVLVFGFSATRAAGTDTASGTIANESRVVSVYASQDFLNEQIALHMKSAKLIKELKITLDPDKKTIYLRGTLQIPVEEMKAINLDPELGAYKFQFSVKPEASTKGHLVLRFPLQETYFYPANQKNIPANRVVVPVQMLSLALASIRGYLAGLSGDFSGFERRKEKYEALIKTLDHAIAQEKNVDAKEELINQRDAVRLQLEAVPIERKQLEIASKEVSHILSFTGEKELNLDDELKAKKNALVLKIRIDQLVPFLKDVDLGGFRIMHDKKDGNGENYFAVDINSRTVDPQPPAPPRAPSQRQPMKVAPSLIFRLNQAIFESEAIVQAEQDRVGDKIRNLKFNLMDDGLHFSGEFHKIITIPFDTVIDFESTGLDVFVVKVRDVEVAGIDLEFLSGFVLEAMKGRLENMLHGMCTFKYLGETSDGSRTLQVTVDPKKLVPSFPDLHLILVDVRDHEFLMKIGKP